MDLEGIKVCAWETEKKLLLARSRLTAAGSTVQKSF
jgi:hypothetical protein